MPSTDEILKQIEGLGYITAELIEEGGRVIVAEPMVDIDPAKRGPARFRQIVRIDRSDAESRHRAACQLALQCRIDPS